MKNFYIETVHGVLVDIVHDIRVARNSATHTGNNPRCGNTQCRIYVCSAKNEKIYVK